MGEKDRETERQTETDREIDRQNVNEWYHFKLTSGSQLQQCVSDECLAWQSMKHSSKPPCCCTGVHRAVGLLLYQVVMRPTVTSVQHNFDVNEEPIPDWQHLLRTQQLAMKQSIAVSETVFYKLVPCCSWIFVNSGRQVKVWSNYHTISLIIWFT